MIFGDHLAVFYASPFATFWAEFLFIGGNFWAKLINQGALLAKLREPFHSNIWTRSYKKFQRSIATLRQNLRHLIGPKLSLDFSGLFDWLNPA